MEYEYVCRNEYGVVREKVEEIIRKAHRILRKSHGIAFQHGLIGSGKRHLVMRQKGGNKGFDLDYNLVLPSKPDIPPREIKEWFREAFNQAVNGTEFDFPENSTSVLTIKAKDQQHKRIFYGVDFAIIYYSSDDKNDGYYYLKKLENDRYCFEFRSISRKIERKLEEIKQYENGWNWIRDEYEILKCRNKDDNKNSFSLYLESIHNVYNQIQQSKPQEEDNQAQYWQVQPWAWINR